MKRIRRLLRQPERPSAAWTPVISVSLLLVSAGIAFASWQTPPAPKPQPAIVAAPSVPAPAVAVELPVAPVRKPARVLLAQARQVAQTQQTTSIEQQLKDALQREVTAGPEPTDPYKKWLNEDVAYIITDQERAAFKALTNDAEREQFITQFWQIRDPTPNTAENEFKDEHYRRIAYANTLFASKKSEWCVSHCFFFFSSSIHCLAALNVRSIRVILAQKSRSFLCKSMAKCVTLPTITGL